MWVPGAAEFFFLTKNTAKFHQKNIWVSNSILKVLSKKTDPPSDLYTIKGGGGGPAEITRFRQLCVGQQGGKK